MDYDTYKNLKLNQQNEFNFRFNKRLIGTFSIIPYMVVISSVSTVILVNFIGISNTAITQEQIIETVAAMFYLYKIIIWFMVFHIAFSVVQGISLHKEYTKWLRRNNIHIKVNWKFWEDYIFGR